jgi:hypothetical protein
VLSTGRALHARGLPAIPVRSCLPEGREWEELTPEMSSAEWSITVSIQSPQTAGRMAHYQAIAFAVDRGWMTQEEAIRESGNPYPMQVKQQIQIEKLEASPMLIQSLEQLIQQRFFAAVQQQQAGGMPTQPLMPAALANVLAPLAGDPSLGALATRLPQMQPGQQFGVPGVSNMPALPAGQAGGIGGGPNMFALDQGLPPMPRAESINKGGGFAGVGQSSPGSVANQDLLNARR